MGEPDFEALSNLSCPVCNKKAGEHSHNEHRRCATVMLKQIGIIPEGVNLDQVEIVTSDDLEDAGASELMGKITGRGDKKHSHGDNCESDIRELLQSLLEDKFPERPQSEDFWVMNQIIAEIDVKDQQTENPEEFFDYLCRHTDKDAAMYVGLTRANDALVEGMKNMKQTTHLLALLHAVWMDGFAVGQELHQAHRQQS